MSSPTKASSPTDSRASSPPPPPPSIAKAATTNGTRSRSTAASKAASTQPSPSHSYPTGLATRVIAPSLLIIILALFLASQSSIPFLSSFSPFDIFKSSATARDSSSSSSHSTSYSSSHSSSSPHQRRHNGQSQGKETDGAGHKFGQPWSDTIPSSSPMFTRHRASQTQEHERRQRDEKEQQQRHRQQHSSPFDDFFGGGGSHNEPEDDSGAASASSDDSSCKGYYCEEAQVCVDRPIQCPCPYDSDTKCLRGEWYVCYRGPHKC
ncbi:MAG: hypothetical protein J3R72DRAFT_529228 [Linnemannia gamsii]|nr:MAG: hypothetical protein J3R72DRAFT_529228 [Linnemannia gamsii]